MNMRIFLPFLFVLLGANLALAGEKMNQGPFSGIDLSTLKPTQAKIIKEANVDFLLVLKGEKPRYAQFNKEMPLPADGGTTYYSGDHYELTVVQSLSTFGNLNGYIYGPVVDFDKQFSPGNMNTVSNLRFYTSEQLKELKKHANKAPQPTQKPRG
jgi:hypothetical protein